MINTSSMTPQETSELIIADINKRLKEENAK
jgi:hypothetical protein